jgi:plasmid stabilization system protein ParE
MKVVITAAAKADLLAIRRYIEADNPSRALSFVEEPGSLPGPGRHPQGLPIGAALRALRDSPLRP